MTEMFIQKDPSIESRRRMAELLLSRRQPIRHWSDGMANAVNSLTAAWLDKKADKEEKERRETRQKALADALGIVEDKPYRPMPGSIEGPGGYTGRVPGDQPMDLVRALMQDPMTADYGAQLGIQMRLAQDKEERERRAKKKTTLMAEELKALGLPQGTIAQRGPFGGLDIVREAPKSGPIKVGNTLVDPVTFEPLYTAPQSAGDKPSKIQTYEFYKNLSPEDRQIFDASARATQYLNLGDRFVQPTTGQSYTKEVPPEDQPELKGEQAAAKEAGTQLERARGKWRSSETKLITALSSAKDRKEVIDATIAKAKNLLSEWSTSFGASLANVPSTEAKRLSNLLDTIKANVGFSELQSMRAESPTGGALGQVSEMENKLLQSVLGSLDQAGDMNDLAAVLDQISMQREAAIKRLEFAYDADKARYGTDLPAGYQAMDRIDSRVKAQATEIPGESSIDSPSQEDLEYTAKTHGITVEEVKRRLGIK